MAKKIRFFFILVTTFVRKQWLNLLLSAFFSVSLFFLLPQILPLLKLNTDKRIGIIGKYTVSTLPPDIQNLISTGLTTLSPDGTPQPGLAESWQLVNNNKEYLFTLKNGLTWHDGQPVLSSDINYNFNDVATSAVDPQTVKFTLKEPFPPFPVIVSQPIFQKGLLGTGEYQVKAVESTGQIIERLHLSKNLTFKFYPNEKAAKTAFKLGELDEIRGITDVNDLSRWNNIKITPQVNYHQFVALFFDTQNPKYSSKSFRQALAYALKDRWEPIALTPISPLSWAYNKDVKPYAYDLENAKNLLGKSGGENNEPVKTIDLATTSSLIPTAEQIKLDWQQLGIETKIKVIQSLDEGFDLLLVTQEIPADPDQYALWHSTQEGNISHYKSPKVDGLLEEGRKSFDQEKRREIYFDFQKALAEDLPAIFLFYPTSYTLSR